MCKLKKKKKKMCKFLKKRADGGRFSHTFQGHNHIVPDHMENDHFRKRKLITWKIDKNQLPSSNIKF